MFPFLRAGLVSVIAYKASVGEKASKRDETDSEIFRAMAKNFFVLFIGVAASLFPLAIAYGLLTDKM